jgi:hypothetical protein
MTLNWLLLNSAALGWSLVKGHAYVLNVVLLLSVVNRGVSSSTGTTPW